MSDAILAVLLGVLTVTGIATTVRAVLKSFEAKAVAPLPPPVECVHEWEPWSEPQDTNVQMTTTYYGGIGSTKTETAENTVKKFQDRVCAQCNIYERRWA